MNPGQTVRPCEVNDLCRLAAQGKEFVVSNGKHTPIANGKCGRSRSLRIHRQDRAIMENQISHDDVLLLPLPQWGRGRGLGQFQQFVRRQSRRAGHGRREPEPEERGGHFPRRTEDRDGRVNSAAQSSSALTGCVVNPAPAAISQRRSSARPVSTSASRSNDGAVSRQSAADCRTTCCVSMASR